MALAFPYPPRYHQSSPDVGGCSFCWGMKMIRNRYVYIIYIYMRHRIDIEFTEREFLTTLTISWYKISLMYIRFLEVCLKMFPKVTAAYFPTKTMDPFLIGIHLFERSKSWFLTISSTTSQNVQVWRPGFSSDGRSRWFFVGGSIQKPAKFHVYPKKKLNMRSKNRISRRGTKTSG